MKFDREVKIDSLRIDYLLTLDIGIEVKDPSELKVKELTHGILRYLDKLDYLILLIKDVGFINTNIINELLSYIPSNRISIAIGSEYNPLTWKSIYDKNLIETIKYVLKER